MVVAVSSSSTKGQPTNWLSNSPSFPASIIAEYAPSPSTYRQTCREVREMREVREVREVSESEARGRREDKSIRRHDGLIEDLVGK